MAKKRRGRFTWKEGQLIQMAATSATLEEAAASFRTSVETIRKKAEMLGVAWKGRDGRKSRFTDWGVIRPDTKSPDSTTDIVRAATSAGWQQQDSNPAKTGNPSL
jgi:hypothetical protein